MKPLVEIYYNFIQDFTYESIEYFASYFTMPHKYKTIMNICDQYIYNNTNIDLLILDLQTLYNINTKSFTSYKNELFKMEVYSNTNIYILDKIINYKDKIDLIKDFLKKQNIFITIIEKIENDINSMLNFIFFNIIFNQYRRFSNSIHFKGNYFEIKHLSFKKFRKIYEEEYVKNIFDEIGEVIFKFKFIEKYLHNFVLQQKILWIENNKYTNNLFSSFYNELLPYKYINSCASNEIENKTIYSKLTYELVAGDI